MSGVESRVLKDNGQADQASHRTPEVSGAGDEDSSQRDGAQLGGAVSRFSVKSRTLDVCVMVY